MSLCLRGRLRWYCDMCTFVWMYKWNLTLYCSKFWDKDWKPVKLWSEKWFYPILPGSSYHNSYNCLGGGQVEEKLWQLTKSSSSVFPPHSSTPLVEYVILSLFGPFLAPCPSKFASHFEDSIYPFLKKNMPLKFSRVRKIKSPDLLRSLAGWRK